MKAKPQRMCLACRTLKDKQQLIRIVSYEGVVSVDETGKKNGRGAYVCRNRECIAKAKKANLFSKAFKCRVDTAVYEFLADNYGQD